MILCLLFLLFLATINLQVRRALMRFGERLQKARTEMNLTQGEVAQKFFITRQTISNWENEKTYPDVASLIKLSDYYHISLDTLLKEDVGMREYLEKREVSKELKPIYRNLILIDLLLCSILLGDAFNLIHLGAFILPILLMVLLTFSAIFDLNNFNQTRLLGLKYQWQKYLSGDNGLKYAVILPAFLIISGMIALSFKTISIGVALTVVGVGLLFIIILRKKVKK
jgi:transcriptional regulator with XRE-family HTH domain